MTLHILALGTLTADPVRRTAKSGHDFATCSLRCSTEDGPIFISAIAFNAAADELLRHQAGASISISGRAKLATWTGKDRTERTSISLTVEQVASASAAWRAEASRRREASADGGGK